MDGIMFEVFVRNSKLLSEREKVSGMSLDWGSRIINRLNMWIYGMEYGNAVGLLFNWFDIEL